jgi:predicted MFS family arabinose efflux permease
MSPAAEPAAARPEPRAPSAERPAVPVGLLAFTAGAAVANLYYCQPLLPAIGRTFGVANGREGLVSTAAQVGYALGLLVFVPLGDRLERRRLIVSLLVAVSAALAAAAAAPSFGWLVAASVAVGVTTVVPQLVIPFAAGLTPPTMRGSVVGRIMGGLLIGILGARVVAGAVGDWLGWRAMFAIAAALMLLLAAALARLLPPAPPRAAMPLRTLFGSLVELARREPVLRDASTIGALVFLAFSAFWTTLAFRLELAPLHYGSTVAGLFGLVGIVGASVAPLAGRFADRSTPRTTVGYGLVVLMVSYVLFWLAGHTIAGLVAGVILVDAGMQVVNVSNQARIYSLPEEAHSRLNTVYMVSYFAGGSLGSALGVWAWGRWRWSGVCALATASVAAALVVYLRGRRNPALVA